MKIDHASLNKKFNPIPMRLLGPTLSCAAPSPTALGTTPASAIPLTVIHFEGGGRKEMRLPLAQLTGAYPGYQC